MDTVFLRILNMSIAAGWLILAVIALRLFWKKAPRWILCILWGLAAVRLICPVSPESSLSLLPSAETVPPTLVQGPSFAVDSGIEFIDVPINEYLDDHYFEGVTVPTANGSTLMTVLGTVWLVGMGCMLLYAAWSWNRLRCRVRVSLPLGNGVFLCDAIETPFILGIFRPRIYLPSGMMEENGSDSALLSGTLAHVVAHEKAHLARRDHWWKPIGFVLLSVYWFHPLVWVGYILLCQDIELACDEKVIKGLAAEEKKAYSMALLSCSTARPIIAACPLAFGEVGVKDRIQNVLHYKKPGFWIVTAAAAICLVFAVFFLTSPPKTTLHNIGEGGYANLLDGIESLDFIHGDYRYSTDFPDHAAQRLAKLTVYPDPISQSREENRDRTYEIVINGTGTRICISENFSVCWLDNGVKPSLSYRLREPEKMKALLSVYLPSLGSLVSEKPLPEPESADSTETADPAQSSEHADLPSPPPESSSLEVAVAEDVFLYAADEIPQTVLDYALQNIRNRMEIWNRDVYWLSAASVFKAQLTGIREVPEGHWDGPHHGVYMYRAASAIELPYADRMNPHYTDGTVWNFTDYLVFYCVWENGNLNRYPVGSVPMASMQELYGTPEMLEKYGNMYLAASTEMYNAYRESLPVGFHAVIRAMQDGHLTVDMVEYITAANTVRIAELGLTEKDLINGYCILNDVEAETVIKLPAGTTFRFYDWGDTFTDPEDPRYRMDGERWITTQDPDIFAEYLATYNPYPRMPFIFAADSTGQLLIREIFLM